ncbi:MAG: serine/threonine-protein kinase [Candidatus Melainabacteria bacterium]|nr:serine/threonine-protein kinase [Candidatus Melainabacteria bacterium]
MVTVGDDPLLGMVVEGRYKIQSVIGQGSAGTVYKAVQELIGREVAIKVLHDYLVSDDEFIKRFRQEAKASSRLSHPNIITIYDFGLIPEGQRPYIAMDLLIGTPLSDLLSSVERLSLDEAIPVFSQVCSALGEAHRQGVVHRDVKPENIVLVERSGQKLFPIVVDFGIARLMEESDAAKITRTGTVCGSPTYMSPEQCTSSKVDHRSDIYSLGVVIYECLTGEVPFHSDELVRVMAMHLSDPPTPLNQVKPGLVFPEMLEEVVYKSLAKNPDQRFQSMEDFANALEESLKQKVVEPITSKSSTAKAKSLEPGPLAQQDSLHMRSQSQEMPAPRGPSSRDLASRALEELQSRGPNEPPSNAVQEQINSMRQQMRNEQSDEAKTHALKAGDFSRGRNGGSGATQKALVVVVALVSIALLYFTLSSQGLVPMFSQKDPTIEDAKALIAKGNTSEAIAMLGDLINDTNKEVVSDLYIKVAKSQASKHDFPQAIETVKKVPADSKQTKTAQTLAGQWEKAASVADDPEPIKDKPPKKGPRRRRPAHN